MKKADCPGRQGDRTIFGSVPLIPLSRGVAPVYNLLYSYDKPKRAIQVNWESKLLGFYAYPEAPLIVSTAIDGAVELSALEILKIKPWKKMKILGFRVDHLIRDEIHQADVLIADITYPNYNVLYEIGYAIASGKPVIPTVNISIDKAIERIQKIGLFDTLGWATYSNSNDLSEKLRQWEHTSWVNKNVRPKDHEQPLFILDTQAKTDFRNHIFNAVENSHVNFRSFDPAEVSRLTAAKAISDIAASAGVIIPILSEDLVGSLLHNQRAAFMLGLAHGYQIQALAIQYENGPVPLDYREFITNSTYRHETEKHVTKYCAETLIWNQRASLRDRQADAGILGHIDLGSPTAENETQQLEYYFVRTAEFSRALRAEGAIVIGRKGSGKSAVYFQIAAESGKNKSNCIVDLRPASHSLSEMREALLDVVNAGVFDHTVAAFWQYIIYYEIVLKIREILLPKSTNNFALQERIRQMEDSLSLSEAMVAGDFTSRLETAVRDVIRITSRISSATELRSQLTNAMFENLIPKLRSAVSSFRDFFDCITILIDDLDKGWPPRQVESHDVITVKHLIEVLNRIQRDMSKNKLTVKHLVFLRSDIYEKLVEQTSDRGKYNVIKVDWSDAEQLRYLLKQRVNNKIDVDRQPDAWNAINPLVNLYDDAVDRMIENSLRRPRFLIDLCERVLSFAINRGHQKVTGPDVEEGLRQMSLYLVSDFGYEMRDIAGTPEDIFYAFIGKSELLTEEELKNILSDDKLGLGFSETMDLLLWYGFLGLVGVSNRPVFIYDCAYDFRRLEAEKAPSNGEILYAVNPAFLRGLKPN